MKSIRMFLCFMLYTWITFPLISGNPEKSFTVRLDKNGPFLILASRTAEREYKTAIALSGRLHAGSRRMTFDIEHPESILSELKTIRPRYIMIFLAPSELDVELAWKWIHISAGIDSDPFVDTRTGFITGESPEAVRQWIERIGKVIRGEIQLPAAMVDNLGPNSQMQPKGFSKTKGSFMVPLWAEFFPFSTLSHGTRGFGVERLKEMGGAGIVHFGGHGYPDRVVDCLNGPFARRVPFSPCVIFNGACYTGVTGRWFDLSSGKAIEKQVLPAHSFCLGVLANRTIAYLAALHADHGIPVYQEMEFLAYSGGSLGDVIKHTHDGAIMANGGGIPKLSSPKKSSSLFATPADIMIRGTLSRVLFGDPSLVLIPALTAPPFRVSLLQEPDRIHVKAVTRNSKLKTTFFDTYHNDLSQPVPFNGRALISVDCSGKRIGSDSIHSSRATTGGKRLPSRLVGYALEYIDSKTILHIQIDVPATQFLESAIRKAGTTVEFISAGKARE